jgi:hypothetical protein
VVLKLGPPPVPRQPGGMDAGDTAHRFSLVPLFHPQLRRLPHRALVRRDQALLLGIPVPDAPAQRVGRVWIL